MKRNKILSLIQYGGKGIFDVDVEEQKQKLQSLKEPTDDIDRAYCQFVCQNFFTPRWKQIVLNVISAIAMIPILVLFLSKRLYIKHVGRQEAISDAIGIKEIIPSSLSERFDIFFYNKREYSLSLKDTLFIFRIIRRHPFSVMFNLKNIIRIAEYSNFIKQYNPSLFIVHNEYSYTCSILTQYCNANNIKHINVMHGEKLFNIRDSFFHFDKCYVWDEHYVNLFKSLKAEPTQFEIELPNSMRINTDRYKNDKVYADIKYYLANNTENEIISIVESLQYFKQSGKRLKYRPHPIYTDMTILRKHVSEDEIEDPVKVSIFESISNLEFAVSSYSTVLMQAYYAGRQSIIDDITYKERYCQLSKLQYFMIDKCSNKLSNLLILQ